MISLEIDTTSNLVLFLMVLMFFLGGILHLNREFFGDAVTCSGFDLPL